MEIMSKRRRRQETLSLPPRRPIMVTNQDLLPAEIDFRRMASKVD
jgi:hypothetical protein